MSDLEELWDLQLADLREIPIDNFSYIGDAVIALVYKLRLLNDGRIKTRTIYENSKKFLSAKSHSKFVDLIYSKFTSEEMNYYKRAVNSNGAKKRGNDADYRKSTGFEAVIGYLFLTHNYSRINELLEVIDSCMSTEKTY
ncbi:Mini-ribonuclease 3 [Petrotoga sp. 9PW.55.5.1]|uniref:Mini-ribonuclease 3 n=1 Tax=Petrotoga sp. 9PW.55.5.1 TaxID=1308979 RepID=UPI000DD71885|nr:ribonuclease III domain-containing protein [Petrotoga sp. 9PW.55.5.1]